MKGIQKTPNLVDEVVELTVSIEEISSTSATAQAKVTPGKTKSKRGTWISNIRSKYFSGHGMIANLQNTGRKQDKLIT